MKISSVPLLSALLMWMFAPSIVVQACPNCATAQVVQSAVWTDDFWTNLLVVLLPLFVLAGVCALLYRIDLQHQAPFQSVRTGGSKLP